MTTDDNIKLFITRFNCACNRINKNNKSIEANRISSSSVSLLGLQSKNPLQSHWQRDTHIGSIHPLSEMIIGKKHSVSNCPIIQLEQEYQLINLIFPPFVQGFVIEPNYKDVWGNYQLKHSTSYNSSLMFALGRAFLHKFSGVKLSYILPTPFQLIFNELK